MQPPPPPSQRIVQVLDFASARAPELAALHELSRHAALVSPADAKLTTQFARRRRRANAFKSHVLPRRLRQRGSTSADAANGARTGESTEIPRCRQHTRRPQLLAEQRSWATVIGGDSERAVWLPTHVWHSKRMKMVERYGLAFAAHRADKSVSASLEALRSKAILHDASYYGVLELYGLPQLILEALQLVSDPAGSDFHGMRFLAGGEEGQSMLYYEHQFPSGAICPVTFMWRPLQADARATDAATGSSQFELRADWQETKRQLWLWIHPAAFVEAADAIATACRAVVEGSDDECVASDRRDADLLHVHGELTRLCC
ncbi:hypothetical protein PybrP1_010917 [[Pythium] brassicae (nom. inval.)]|nr:hypothetical protein PybrP1_010917 [[Pythium] brassicae (nom. inval.)]